MSEPALRDATIEFVRELCESVGPFVFAGFGGRIARLRHEVHQAHGEDIAGGVFAAEAEVERVMRAWADSAPLPATIGVLLDLFVAPPAAVLRYTEDWRSELTELLYLCGRRDRPALAAELAARGETLAPLATELQEWFDDEEEASG